MRFRITCASLGVFTGAVFVASLPAHAATITPYTDPAAFAANATNTTSINFEGLAPANSFQYYPNSSGGLTTNGVSFLTSGTGPFGTGQVTVYSSGYAAGQPAYNTGTGAILTWGAPNEPGTAYLNATLPSGTTAVGTNLWTVQPFSSTVQVTVASGGSSQTFPVSTSNRPAASFFGVTSTSPINSLQFGIPAGQVGLILDNFRFGTAAAAVTGTTGPSGSTGPNAPTGSTSGPTTSSVPEPGTLLLLGGALCAVALVGRRKRS